MYYMFTKIRNLMLSDFTRIMYGSCLSTTQSTALLQKQLEKLYCNVHMQYFTLFLFPLFISNRHSVSLVFCICRNVSDFANSKY